MDRYRIRTTNGSIYISAKAESFILNLSLATHPKHKKYICKNFTVEGCGKQTIQKVMSGDITRLEKRDDGFTWAFITLDNSDYGEPEYIMEQISENEFLKQKELTKNFSKTDEYIRIVGHN